MRECAHCGGDAEMIDTNTEGFYVQCEKCYVSTDFYDTPEEARAAWNRRTGEMAEWTEEVPTEEGWYWLAIKDGDADWYAIVVEVEQSLGKYYVRSHLFEDAVYQDMFQCWCDYETNTENIMAADDCEVRWRKIPTPPLPGKEGK